MNLSRFTIISSTSRLSLHLYASKTCFTMYNIVFGYPDCVNYHPFTTFSRHIRHRVFARFETRSLNSGLAYLSEAGQKTNCHDYESALCARESSDKNLSDPNFRSGLDCISKVVAESQKSYLALEFGNRPISSESMGVSDHLDLIELRRRVPLKQHLLEFTTTIATTISR